MADATPLKTYRGLREDLEAAGCFQTAPWRALCALPANLLASLISFWVASQTSLWLAVPLFVVGSILFYRLGWLMHDAAHGGTFEDAKANRLFASLTAGILGEFPSGWRYGHNRHHAATNVRGKDPDQSERWNPKLRFPNRTLVFISLFLFTRVGPVYLPSTLLLLGVRDGIYCYIHHRKNFLKELLGVICGLSLQLVLFGFLFGPWLGLGLFFVHTQIGMLYLNMVFAANHYDLPNYTPEEARHIKFEELQAHTSRNYTGGLWSRFIFGGLEKQLEHHLFPSLPRHKLHRAAPITKEFCVARGLPYHENSFSRSFGKVLDFHVGPPPTLEAVNQNL